MVEIGFGPSAGHCACEPQVSLRVDEHQLVAKLVPTSLKHDRRVEDDHRMAVFSGDLLELLLQSFANPRMRKRFQVRQLARTVRRRCKHNLAEGGPVDVSVRAKNAIAPTSTGGCLHFRFAQYLMASLVGVEHKGSAA